MFTPRKSVTLEKLRRGETVFCFKSNLSCPRALEIAAMNGFECLWVCEEHVANDRSVLESQILAMKSLGADLVVQSLHKTLPALTQLLAESRAKGIEEGVLAEVIRRTAEHQPKAPLAYLRSSLDQCAARGCKTLDQFQAAHSGSGRGLRVDRATPSGHDFLADAATRPFRRKRRDAAAEPVYEKLP